MLITLKGEEFSDYIFPEKLPGLKTMILKATSLKDQNIISDDVEEGKLFPINIVSTERLSIEDSIHYRGILPLNNAYTIIPLYGNANHMPQRYRNIGGFIVPYNCQNPNRVLNFLDWIMSDEKNFYKMSMGLKGQDYDLDENGLFIALEDGQALKAGDKIKTSSFFWKGSYYFSHPDYTTYSIYDFKRIDKLSLGYKPESVLGQALNTGEYYEDLLYMYELDAYFEPYLKKREELTKIYDQSPHYNPTISRSYEVTEEEYDRYESDLFNFIDNYKLGEGEKFEPDYGKKIN